MKKPLPAHKTLFCMGRTQTQRSLLCYHSTESVALGQNMAPVFYTQRPWSSAGVSLPNSLASDRTMLVYTHCALGQGSVIINA